MRRRTALGLGGVTAATALLLGLGGTTALLSDTTSVSTVAGAGSLTLTGPSSHAREELPSGTAVTIPLHAELTRGTSVALQVSLVEKPGANPCPVGVVLTIDVPSGTWPQPVDLCDLAPDDEGERPVTFLVVDDLPTSADLSLSVLATADPAVADVAWPGALRFTLRHTVDGFSDQVDVPVLVTSPPRQVVLPPVAQNPSGSSQGNGNGNAGGNGNTGSNGNPGSNANTGSNGKPGGNEKPGSSETAGRAGASVTGNSDPVTEQPAPDDTVTDEPAVTVPGGTTTATTTG
ncbi:hypothetical protein [Geodermatophilus sp. CPCC 205761]|uniref:hypothetical protein n=1 Tax=Geodermatophilus sp. CPCC 205761 TaxID=2936597 RepID=UPI003EEB394F